MQNHEKIDYVEFPSKDIKLTKAFFKSKLATSTKNGSALIVFYSKELE